MKTWFSTINSQLVVVVVLLVGSRSIHFIFAGKPLAPPVVDAGLSDIVASATVYCSLIFSDGNNDVRISSSLAGTAFHANFSSVSKARTENYQHLIAYVPFKVTKWPSIFAKPCPHHLHGHRSVDRGIGLSHYQIWLEFTFFDQDLLEALTRPKPEYLNSTSYSSSSGTFRTLSNGTFYKNNIPFLENDILVVLEETAFLAVNTNRDMLKKVLSTELSKMTTDVLLLGWCNHNSTSNANNRGGGGHSEHVKQRGVKSHIHGHHSSAHTWAPHSQSCLYAYAVTRRGARRLARHYDMCGSVSLEEQVLAMSRYGWITSSRVSSGSVKSMLDNGGGNIGGAESTTSDSGSGGSDLSEISPLLQQLRNETKTSGIFHQMRERF